MAAREPRRVEIDGYAYLLAALPPREALKLGNRVVRAAGPGILTLIGAASGSVRLLDMDLSVLGQVAQNLFVTLSPEEQDAVMAKVLGPVQVQNGEKLAPVMNVFDAHFAGRLPAALILTWEALRENFQDFGPALAGLFAKGQVRGQDSTSPATS